MALSTVALVIKPSRVSATLAIDAAWKLPSSVTLHAAMVVLPFLKLRGPQVARHKLPWLTLRFLAEPVVVTRPIKSVAASPARMSLLRMCMYLSDAGSLDASSEYTRKTKPWMPHGQIVQMLPLGSRVDCTSSHRQQVPRASE